MVHLTVQMNKQNSDQFKSGTLVEQVMETVRKHIVSRQTVPGARLPSIRSLARSMQVSKSTVVDAYDRLVAEGVVVSRRSSGFYVARHLPPFSIAEIGPRLDQEIDPLWMARQSLNADSSVIKPGCGWLPKSWMPQTEISRTLRQLARDTGDSLTEYSTPQGLTPLRQLLSRRLADTGIEAPAQHIMLTESGTQAIDLLCRYLIEPGDCVVVDDPCYFNFHALLRAHRAKVISVPYTHAGPDLKLFENVLVQHHPRLYITNSALHNPTGATLMPTVAHRLLRLAEQHDLLIIEDDIFADLEQTPAPRLAAFDGLDRVIHIGSFSKTLSAAVRCGFIATRCEWIEELIDLKLATSFGGGSFSSAVVFHLLKDGTYRKHISSLRTRLAHAMGNVITKLKQTGLTPWIEPNAGMFVWCQLPAGLDAGDVARLALVEGIVLAPGNAFSLTQSASGFLRFNVAQSVQPEVFPILAKAMETADKLAH